MTNNHTVVTILAVGLSGCFTWGSRATHRLPKTTALDRSYSYSGEVIVVGAGAAGLAAARVLEDNDVSYTILEATARDGGRLGEDAEFADFAVDLGAEWIHNNAEILDVLSGEAGTADALALVPYHLESAALWDGVDYVEVPQSRLDRRFEFFPEHKFQDSTWFDFVRTHYSQRVEANIRYASPVVSIDHAGERVEVTTTDGSIFVADKVLVAVSIGVLQAETIRFEPALSDSRRDAFDAVEFLRGFKLLLKFSEDFYPDAISCSVDKGEKTYWDVAFGKDVEDDVLGLLATGPTAEAYYALGSDEAIVSAVIKELDVIFEGTATRSFTGEYILQDWGRNEHIRGTWVEGFHIRRSTLRELNESLDRKVYFAGEANDTYRQLGVPGAILSGFHAVDRLLTDQD